MFLPVCPPLHTFGAAPVPRSPLRRRSAYTPPPTKAPVKAGNPRWLVPAMLAAFLLGLAWIVTWYITQGQWPVQAIGNWNLAVGFGLIMVGFALSTRWR